MNMQELKHRRLVNHRIQTDSDGNLILPENPNRISGKAQRARCCNGVFHKKCHADSPDVELGTYTQYNFGGQMTPEQQTDKRTTEENETEE